VAASCKVAGAANRTVAHDGGKVNHRRRQGTVSGAGRVSGAYV